MQTQPQMALLPWAMAFGTSGFCVLPAPCATGQSPRSTEPLTAGGSFRGKSCATAVRTPTCMAFPTKHAALPLGEAVSAWSHFFHLLFPLASLCLTYLGNMALRAGTALVASFWEGWEQRRLLKYQLIPLRGADNHISSIVLAAIMGK